MELVFIEMYELVGFVLDEFERAAGDGWVLEERVLFELRWVNGPQDVLGQNLEAQEAHARHEAGVGRIEVDAERMKLGPLVEAAREDGTRRFHVGDVLTILTERLLSPRLVIVVTV